MYLAVILVFYALTSAEVANKKMDSNESRELRKPGVVNSSQELIQDAPIHSNLYVLGPGDQISLFIGRPYNIIVNAQGQIQALDQAPIEVQGMSVDLASKKIKESLSANFDTSKVYLSVIKSKKFKYSILGEVVKPGIYEGNSFQRLSEVLNKSGGFAEWAIRDSMTIISKNGVKETVNLSNYFNHFDDMENPYVKMGDKIIVHSIESSTPRCFLMYEDKIYVHSLERSYSVREIFFQINNYNEKKTPSRILQINNSSNNSVLTLDYIAKPGDSIQVENFFEFVFVGGNVAHPKNYSYIKSYAPEDYLYMAGISKESSVVNNYSVIRKGAVINIEGGNQIGLLPGDKIYVEKSSFYLAKEYLEVFSQVASVIISIATVYLITK